ncbi:MULTISPECIES: hypothetical protein [unclassified Pseudomonas]|uniref:hypothetical protein n=1 Tax=unclassified Pseudomonas TaxID=196821 RepID=UPI000B82E4BA|nr:MULTISPECIES: hypothetical protein [unclassified Pseudomonas]
MKSKHPPQLESKLHTFAYSYLRLKSIGVEFIENDYNFYISDSSHELINTNIERICREYGGEELLSALLDRLGKTYSAITGRLMEYRQVSMGTTEVHAAMPFGYLLAIASKYAGTRGNKDPRLLDRLLMLIADIIVVYEIQPYSQLEAMYIKEEGLIEFIRTNILYDNFVGIAQTKASYASSLIKLLHAKFDGAKYESFGVPVKDVARVALALISKAEPKKFTTVTVKDLALKTRIPEFKILAAMDNLLSVASGDVNSGLQFPPSSLDIDHYFKPAIKIGKTYKIFPKSIASLGCINTVCASIGLPNGKWANEIDSELGYAIEEYLRRAFVDKGISITYGDRFGGDSDLEVDLLCETDKDIFIFEMKKKGLTRQAQSGDQSKILTDLADSVLASHFQAMRIENVLKNNDSLHLINKEGEQTIRLNNRQVQRISVSLPDFGALQDKTVLQRLLTIAAFSHASHPNSDEDKKLRKWREYSEKLKNLAMANGELDEHRMPFHNSLFMSIPQIIMILEKSDDANDFFKHIKSFIGMTTGSRDTYTEFLNRLTFLDRCKAEGLPV